MSRTAGTRLGLHEVTTKIGEGGMDEVCRVRATKAHSNLATIVALAALGPFCCAPVSAQQVGQDSYTSAQADVGARIYAEQCLVCHLDDLQGSFEAPELAGPNFRSTWRARPVTDLLNLVASTMPPQAVGSLTSDGVADVVAYLLQANGVQPRAPVSSPWRHAPPWSPVRTQSSRPQELGSPRSPDASARARRPTPFGALPSPAARYRRPPPA